MALAGFSIIKEGPAAGLLWVDFKVIEVHGDRNSPEYQIGLRQKAQQVERFIIGSLRAGIRHFNLQMKELMTPLDILMSYARQGGFAVDMLKDKNIREKFELLVKQTGIDEARIIRAGR
jgi:hypothetical protein